jgi:hypothetical protein
MLNQLLGVLAAHHRDVRAVPRGGKKIAKVAMARRLAVRLTETGDYRELELHRPEEGRRTLRKRSASWA